MPSPGFIQATLSCTDTDVLQGLGASNSGVTVKQVKKAVSDAGIIAALDPRVSEVFKSLNRLDDNTVLSRDQFFEAAADNLTLLHRIATGEMTISNFAQFTAHLDCLKKIVEPDTSGKNADYIPILRDAPSDKLGIAFCSVDGQFYEIGDSRDHFSIQSTSKPLTFALAMEMLGSEPVLNWCGIEPSGRPFNDVTFLDDNRPFNPMVNSGALMTAATLASAYPKLAKRDGPTGTDGTYGEELCNEILLPLWQRLSGDGIVGDVGFCEETFLSERKTACTNIGIAHLMASRKGLPPNVGIHSMLDFYLRACSITTSTAGMAIVAATLANGGRNPITNDQVFSVDVVKRTLSVLSFCGFYDNAGEFFYHTGVPSKSGVSGVVFLVLPNVGGFAIFSPRLDRYGNSVRGSAFAKQLVELFTFHSFDSLSSNSTGCKLDPRFNCDFSRQRSISRLRWALHAGDRQARKFDELLVNLCLRVALVDGIVAEEEMNQVIGVYESIMHRRLSLRDVESRLQKLGKGDGKEGLESLYESVSKEERNLDDTKKALLIEATLSVATADGVIAKQEREILATLSRAIKIDPMVMEFHLSSWEMKKRGLSSFCEG